MPFCSKHFVTCLAAAVLAAAAAGCGSDGPPADPPASSPEDPGGETARSPSDSAARTASKPTSDPLHPTVVFETSLGRVLVRLDAEKAPLTVDNFLSYVDQGYYDLTIFDQVIKEPGLVVLGGAYTAQGAQKETGTAIYNEAHNLLKNRRGTIAMARRADSEDSATCHFFFNLTDNEALDHKDRTTPEGYGYCVFGEVIEGLDVLDQIGQAQVHDTENFVQTPVETVMINSLRRLK